MNSQGWGSRRALASVVAISLLLGVVASLAWAGRFSAVRDEERNDLNLFLESSAAGWSEVTTRYFGVPENSARLVAALSQRSPSAEDTFALLAEAVRAAESIDAAFVGYPDGGFIFLARTEGDEADEGEFRTRQIEISADGRERVVTTGYLDQDLSPLSSAIDPNDTYDPRVRVWFMPIADGADYVWTAPYVFASSGEPGITYSNRIVGADGELVAVAGVDLRLTQMTSFLNELRPGQHGDAAVFDRSGAIIAQSEVRDNVPGIAELVASGDILAARSASPSAVRSADNLRTLVARETKGRTGWTLALAALDADFLRSEERASTRKVTGVIAVGVATAAFAALLGLLALRYSDALRAEAEHDDLTGVLSRRGISRVLAQRLRSSRPVALGIIDLDRFKAINDDHGHPVGDRVLVMAARRIDAFATARGAVAGRLGGDEFVVIADETMEWADLSGLLAASMELDGRYFTVGASIGVSISRPERRLTGEEMFRDADLALFEVKRAGGGRHGLSSDRRALRRVLAIDAAATDADSPPTGAS